VVNIYWTHDFRIFRVVNIYWTDHPEYTAVVGSINIANLKIWKSWVQ
jgi:hypothetical protein